MMQSFRQSITRISCFIITQMSFHNFTTIIYTKNTKKKNQIKSKTKKYKYIILNYPARIFGLHKASSNVCLSTPKMLATFSSTSPFVIFAFSPLNSKLPSHKIPMTTRQIATQSQRRWHTHERNKQWIVVCVWLTFLVVGVDAVRVQRIFGDVVLFFVFQTWHGEAARLCATNKQNKLRLKKNNFKIFCVFSFYLSKITEFLRFLHKQFVFPFFRRTSQNLQTNKINVLKNKKIKQNFISITW